MNKPVGLFDYSSFFEIVSSLENVLNRTEKDIVKKLFFEALKAGTTVRHACDEFGVTPHVYNEAMERFYSETDAFVFELVVSHMRSATKKIDRRVIRAVDQYAEEGRMLCLGDGIGTDTIRFAEDGFNVTYFEFDGPSSNFARHRFARSSAHQNIDVINNLDNIPHGKYDIVINREVLEHVHSPPRVVENIWNYLDQDAIVIVTESFSRVNEQFPTHLASNQKYAGKTDFLFVKNGFELFNTYPRWRPLVLRKTDKDDFSRYTSLFTKSRVKDAVRRVGRVALNAFTE
jgi:SAM-dependent methyltransferase